MKKTKDMVISKPELSKTSIAYRAKMWKSDAAVSTVIYANLLGGTMGVMTGGLLFPSLEYFVGLGLSLAGINAYSVISGRAKHLDDSMAKKKTVKTRDLLRIPGTKQKKELLESYYINHPREFRGLVTKSQAGFEPSATHLVKSYLVTGKGRPRIEQEITETQGHKWDKALESIDSLMTYPSETLDLPKPEAVSSL